MLGNIIHAITGNLDQDDLTNVNKQFEALRKHQNQLADASNDQKVIIIHLFNHVKNLTTKIATLDEGASTKLDEIDRKHMKFSAETELLMEVMLKVNKFTSMVEGLLTMMSLRHATGKVLTAQMLTNASASLLDNLGDDEYFPFANVLEAILQSQLEISRSEQMITGNRMWKLYRIEKQPIIDAEHLTIIGGPKFIAVAYEGATTDIENIDHCWATKKAKICEFPNQIKNTPHCFGNALKTAHLQPVLCQPYLSSTRITRNAAVRTASIEVIFIVVSKLEVTVTCKDRRPSSVG
jgi:hypothetical protein